MSPSLPEKAADTTAESPWPLRLLSMKISDYVDRMSPVWVEGQVVQVNRRPGARSFFLTLRDADVDMSLTVTMPVPVLDRLPVPLQDGARVVVHAKPSFWPKRGTLQLEGRDLRPVGEGELLARLEHLKQLLRSEGLFDPARKRPLPFLPNTIGLVCGRGSAAMRDVVENSRRRWPGVRFEVREVPVQGNDAVAAVSAAVVELDKDPQVDVIVVTRGGGSFEDLLPFSNEALIRAVAAIRTPLVSAIGHEVDTPLLDFVADLRASTPTDAAKRIVPDMAAERERLEQARERARRALASRLATEHRQVQVLRSRPVLADPRATLTPHRLHIDAARERARSVLRTRLMRANADIQRSAASLRALSPQSTLERGYAIVLHRDGRVVMDRTEVEANELLRVRVARGDFGVRPVSKPARSRRKDADA
ncbi:exodeoxyribonuclease VII large subunit [Gephyromycinifex aptenodytis]|uniref:exodeoxyribonuclease VII large subunit n=1 Tax=Gephyromycinifex aptenodytis TaxID=2716227 RepID=UPI001446BAA3|nr:exodeoxyribonuclease VII large subunit [Gephyromycinifex aptenodytis]